MCAAYDISSTTVNSGMTLNNVSQDMTIRAASHFPGRNADGSPEWPPRRRTTPAAGPYPTCHGRRRRPRRREGTPPKREPARLRPAEERRRPRRREGTPPAGSFCTCILPASHVCEHGQVAAQVNRPRARAGAISCGIWSDPPAWLAATGARPIPGAPLWSGPAGWSAFGPHSRRRPPATRPAL